jgi:tetratricopeptide (TPR) repeat protein
VPRLPAFLPLLAALGALTPAHAQEDPRTAAKRHYEQGIALTNAADYAGALEQFRQAYAKSPNYAVLYNIGQAEAVLGHLLEAVAALSRYLRDGGAEIPEARREEVKTQIAALEARLAEVTLTTEHTGAVVRVDGRDIGQTPLYEPIRLAPGRHVVILSDGARTLTTTVELRESERRTLSLALPDAAPPSVSTQPPRAAPRPARTSSPAPPVREPAPEPASGTRTVLAYGLAGAGVALGGGALAHYLWNRGRYAEWKTEHATLKADRFAPDYRERQMTNNELAESIQRGSRVSVTLAVAAGALATTGVVLLLTDSGSDENQGVSVSWTGGRSATARAWTAW